LEKKEQQLYTLYVIIPLLKEHSPGASLRFRLNGFLKLNEGMEKRLQSKKHFYSLTLYLFFYSNFSKFSKLIYVEPNYFSKIEFSLHLAWTYCEDNHLDTVCEICQIEKEMKEKLDDYEDIFMISFARIGNTNAEINVQVSLYALK
jgi:hypothetical protein